MSMEQIVSYLSKPWTVSIATMVLMSLVQVSPLQINPWSWLQKLLLLIVGAIGKAFNGNLSKELNAIKGDLDEIKKTQATQAKALADHIAVDDERDMDARRQRILRFNTEIMRGEEFTHEYYCDMLLEIDIYENYCRDHPNYKNSRATMAIANIKRVGEEHEKKQDWIV